MNRHLTWSLIAIFTTLAIGLITLMYIKPLRLLTSKHIPDSYIQNFYYQAYNQQGQLKCIIRSPKLIHYSKPDIAYLDHPNVIFQDQPAPWHITADHGISENNHQKITLLGHVVIRQFAGKQNVLTQLKTTKITIYPQRSLAVSQQPVFIIKGNTQIAGKGFTANFKHGTLTILHHANGVYRKHA